jgi:hypothetical protein
MWPFPSTEPKAPRQDDRGQNRDIILGDEVGRARTRWTRLLIVYLRGLALFCMVRGLIDWSRILGFLGEEDAFEAASLSWQVTLVLYAVLNCVAAVGLWLTSAWGAVLWLIVTICEIIFPWAVIRSVRDAGLGDLALGVMVVVYIILTFLSARERSRDH